MSEIDTMNRQMVGRQGDDVVVMFPAARMTKAEALTHAAWLVALADDSGDEFPEVLRAVQNT